MGCPSRDRLVIFVCPKHPVFIAIPVSCSQYLCPATLDCVGSPIDCPCPDAEDIKCVIPDAEEKEGTVVCVRGTDECQAVERLTRRM
ncbi:hypothetical protein B0H14DRAFT_2664216, partial [Mycena olivaceomarginata]